MIKAERYDWNADIGDSGKREMICVSDLLVDHTYQRAIVSEGNTKAIARDFRWDAFGVLVVGRRDNGSLYVVDGQQRLSAAKRRGDIHHVPCVVFESSGPEHEASVFRSVNMSRKPVGSYDKFRSAVRAGLPLETEINNWLASRGLVVKDDESPHVCRFPSALTRYWPQDSGAVKAAIICGQEIDSSRNIPRDVFRGLWSLEHRGIKTLPEAQKIREQGGFSACTHSIKVVCIEAGQLASEYICAQGVLRVINHKRRNKIQLGD